MNTERGHCRAALSVLVMVAVLLALLVLAPQANGERLTIGEVTEVRELVALADRAMKGELSGSLRWLRWNPHLLRGPHDRTYVPFTLVFEDVAEEAFSSVALYVRVTKRGDRKTSAERDRRIGPTGVPVPVFAYDSAAAASAALRLLDRPDERQPGPYPFEAAYFTLVWWEANTGIVQRALAVPPGSYDVYIAIRERESSLPHGQPPRSGVLKRELEVPDFSSGKGLVVSSPILVETIAPIARPLEPREQVTRPYALGTAEIAPVITRTFTSADTLTIVCFVYNARMGDWGKPNVGVEYRFYRVTAVGEQPFDQPLTQRLDAAALPPEFDLRLGHQIAPIQEVPLASFAPGEYRLEVSVTDYRAHASVARDLRILVR